MIPAALSLPLLRGACSRLFTYNISKSLVLYQNLQFFQSPICSIASNQVCTPYTEPKQASPSRVGCRTYLVVGYESALVDERVKYADSLWV